MRGRMSWPSSYYPWLASPCPVEGQREAMGTHTGRPEGNGLTKQSITPGTDPNLSAGAGGKHLVCSQTVLQKPSP